MLILIIALVVIGYFVFRYMDNLGRTIEKYEDREPEWNPPLPPKPKFPDPNNLPYKTGCCAKCKYCYTGTETEYWFDHDELKGKSKTTRYQNWCLIHSADVVKEVGYGLTEIQHCSMFDPK